MSWVSVAKKPKASVAKKQASVAKKPVPEEGEIEEEYDLDSWKKGMVYLVKGALWGDIDNYPDAEIEECLKKKRIVKEKVVVKPFNCDNCAEACEVVVKKRKLGMVCLKCFDTIPEPVKKEKCKGCSFHIHSNPPADFTPEQRAYCCSICQTSKGRKHGGRCEQGHP